MKRYLTAAAAVTLVLLLGSCTSTSFLGLSRASHVEAEIEGMKTELDQLQAMENELAQAEEKLARAVDDARRLQEAIDELNLLADEFEDELDDIPEETLRELMEAIDAHLNNGVENGEESSAGNLNS